MRKRKFLYGIVGGLFLTGITLLVYFAATQLEGNLFSANTDTALKINYASGFYSQNLHLTVSTPSAPSAKIYYSLDCSTPKRDSASSSLYTQPIFLNVTDQNTVHTIKFIYYDGDTASDVYTYTYVMGLDVQDRFNTLVISLSGDEDSLFGYVNGIFTEGKLRDDYLKANPDLSQDDLDAWDPANYNQRGIEGERAVTAQIFDSDGTSLLTQDCGMRISGFYSRSHSQKSLQLFARKSYDTFGTFHTALFPEITSQTDGAILDRSNRLLLRNSGNDFEHAFIRDTLVQKLATDAGYPLTVTDKPAAIYLNDNYYGFAWVHEPFSSGLMETLYGEFNGEFIKLSVNDYTQCAGDDAIGIEEDSDDEEESDSELEPYNEAFEDMYATYCNADLTDDSVYNSLNKIIDVDNYLQYFAIEMYVGNKDWPYNNMKVYRYVAKDNKYTPGSVFDGRYRYLLFDMDYAFHLDNEAENGTVGYGADEDTIGIISGNDQSVLFEKLMTREDCRAKLVNYLCDLMNDSFSYANVSSTLSALNAERRNELSYFLKTSALNETGETWDDVEEDVASIDTFAAERPGYVYSFIQQDFPIFYPYTLTVNAPEDTQVSINSIESADTAFKGIYYADCGLTLKASVNSGHTFSYWLINGHKYTEQDLTLSADALEALLSIDTSADPAAYTEDSNATVNHVLSVQLVETDKANAQPVIYSIHYQGTNDSIVIYNPSDHTMSLEGYYLSDRLSNYKKYELPATELAAGEKLTLYGKKNTSKKALEQYRLSFNLKNTDVVTLSTPKGKLLGKIVIPDLTEKDTDYVLNLFTGKYTETEPADES